MKLEVELPDKYIDEYYFDSFQELHYHVSAAVDKIGNDFTKKAVKEHIDDIFNGLRKATVIDKNRIYSEKIEEIPDEYKPFVSKERDSSFEPDGEISFNEPFKKPIHKGR